MTRFAIISVWPRGQLTTVILYFWKAKQKVLDIITEFNHWLRQ